VRKFLRSTFSCCFRKQLLSDSAEADNVHIVRRDDPADLALDDDGGGDNNNSNDGRRGDNDQNGDNQRQQPRPNLDEMHYSGGGTESTPLLEQQQGGDDGGGGGDPGNDNIPISRVSLLSNLYTRCDREAVATLAIRQTPGALRRVKIFERGGSRERTAR
jgi:hypothetical protein